ncbi:MAG: SDR family oxidoreductase [Kineosporiaceae bacterium]
MRRLLVTGGSGFLGRRVLAAASGAGFDAVGTTHTAPGMRMDLADPASVRAVVDAVRPDAVVHTAYLQHGPSRDAVIVDGTAALASACARHGARLVHVSTDLVFSGTLGRPYRESDEPDPIDGYGAAKRRAELAAAAACPDSLAVRTSLLLGGRLAPGKIETAVADPTLTFWTDVLRSPTSADDLATALVELVDAELTGVLHVCGADEVSRAELAEVVAGRPVRTGLAPVGVPLDCRMDCSLAASVLATPVRGLRALWG